MILLNSIVSAFFPYLLPNTKLAENIIQFILGGYFAGYFAEVVEAMADIKGNKVAGEVTVKASFDVAERIKYRL